jgi:excisionase family DNA binding protein
MSVTASSTGHDVPPVLLLKTKVVAAQLSIGHRHVDELMRRGELRSVKLGACRRIVAASVPEYVARLIEAAKAA